MPEPVKKKKKKLRLVKKAKRVAKRIRRATLGKNAKLPIAEPVPDDDEDETLSLKLSPVSADVRFRKVNFFTAHVFFNI